MQVAVGPNVVPGTCVRRTHLVALVRSSCTYSAISANSRVVEYGQCGVGAFCLGGCDPIHSHSLNSCTPKPTCQDRKHTFENLDSISPNTEFLGDSSKAEWVLSGTPKQFNDSVLLTLSEDGASAYGTLLASTEYVWYGKVSAYMKSSRGAGVVSAFILLSDVKDEIDYEFVGADLTSAQSNFYFQGITDCEFHRDIFGYRD